MSQRQERFNPAIKIEQMISIEQLVLVVYCRSDLCWQYAIAGTNGSYESEAVYPTAKDAERQGRALIRSLLEQL